MDRSTAFITKEYIIHHPFIKSCLKKGLINYSSLARHIAHELSIEKQSSKEAILVAALRYREELRHNTIQEQRIKELLMHAELEIKNKIMVSILEKQVNKRKLLELQQSMLQSNALFFRVEGSEHYVMITSQTHDLLLTKKLGNVILQKSRDLAIIMIKTSASIENLIGTLSFLTSLLAENDINIKECISCWKDTFFIIDSKDIQKALDVLQFSG